MQQSPDLFGEEADSLEPDWTKEAADPVLLEKLKDVSINAYDTATMAGLTGDGPPYSYAHLNIGCYVKQVLSAADDAENRAIAQGRGKAFVQTASRDAAERAAHDRGDPLVNSILKAAQKCGREIHRIMGFLRFVEKDEYYVAMCAPDNFILHCLAEHFTLRFGNTPWAIIDEKRSLILIRRPSQEASLESLYEEDGNGKIIIKDEFAGDNESTYEDYWRLYHRSLLIESRKNLNLQRQFIPLRYRKYLTEFNNEQ